MQLDKEIRFHPSQNMKAIRADVWVEGQEIMFTLELHATSKDNAEAYIRKVYPDITTLHVYFKD